MDIYGWVIGYLLTIQALTFTPLLQPLLGLIPEINVFFTPGIFNWPEFLEVMGYNLFGKLPGQAPNTRS